jgi:hypothetical protein
MAVRENQVPTEAYTARELVDMALEGHYLLNDVVFEAVWRLWGRYGEAAKAKLYALPDVPAYASKAEVDGWCRRVFDVELELDRQRTCNRLDSDQRQLKFPWS